MEGNHRVTERNYRRKVTVLSFPPTSSFIKSILPLFRVSKPKTTTTYEYKWKLSPTDDVREWQRCYDNMWFDFADGFWSREDFGNPDSFRRSCEEAVFYRTPDSKMYRAELDPHRPVILTDDA